MVARLNIDCLIDLDKTSFGFFLTTIKLLTRHKRQLTLEGILSCVCENKKGRVMILRRLLDLKDKYRQNFKVLMIQPELPPALLCSSLPVQCVRF